MEHFYKNLEGWAAFTDLYVEAVEQAVPPALFVEVGSWLGKSAAFMAVEIINSGKKIEFVCVDPWLDGGPDLKDTKYFKDLKEPVFDIFKRNTVLVKDIITPVQAMSVDAAANITDKSVDFLMLDGDHGYYGIKADIDAWLPKMKPGGMISGDDYLWPGVKRAVHEVFSSDRVRKVIVLNNANYLNSSSYWSVQL